MGTRLPVEIMNPMEEDVVLIDTLKWGSSLDCLRECGLSLSSEVPSGQKDAQSINGIRDAQSITVNKSLYTELPEELKSWQRKWKLI